MNGTKKRIAKVAIWRVLSITVTLLLTFVWTGDIATASFFTLILHTFLLISHWCFETYWEKYVG